MSFQKRLAIVFVLAAQACTMGTPSQWSADAEVERLCAINGGIKIYETVKLPPEKFSKDGRFINFYWPTRGEDTLGPEYIYRWQQTSYKQGNPDLRQTHVEVFRRADGKLLGETILYSRRGGDNPLNWGHPSSFTCPSNAYENQLLMRIFVRE